MSKPVEPYLMSVLSSRLYSIGLEMTNTLMRTARSQLMSVCHDLSTAICDRNGKVIALAESIPVHCANMGLTVRPCFDHPEGIQPGDLFLNNSPYHGNTHHADYTYIAPVFHDGELMFFAVTKGHQADIGNSIPSTYAPTARDMFEEGAIDWPCIKIQKNYKDVPDIIAIAQMHNRVPEMWYGDYLACVGSSRVGEKRLAALCEEYGNETVKRFCEAYQEYGARRMKEELKQLPKGHYEYDIKADAIEGVVPEITIHIECDTHPEEGTIAFDFTKNADSLPCGLNMCEATTLASAVTGVLNRMPCDIPCNDGAMSQIKVKMREGCVIGKAKAPYSSSMATTNESCRPRHFRRAGAHEQDYVEQGHGRRRRDAVPGRRGRLGHGLAQGRCAVRQPDFLRHDGRPGRQWLRWLDHVPVPGHGRRDELELDRSARTAVSFPGRVGRDPDEFRRCRKV